MSLHSRGSLRVGIHASESPQHPLRGRRPAPSPSSPPPAGGPRRAAPRALGSRRNCLWARPRGSTGARVERAYSSAVLPFPQCPVWLTPGLSAGVGRPSTGRDENPRRRKPPPSSEAWGGLFGHPRVMCITRCIINRIHAALNRMYAVLPTEVRACSGTRGQWAMKRCRHETQWKTSSAEDFLFKAGEERILFTVPGACQGTRGHGGPERILFTVPGACQGTRGHDCPRGLPGHPRSRRALPGLAG